jgi:hypothetical protein
LLITAYEKYEYGVTMNKSVQRWNNLKTSYKSVSKCILPNEYYNIDNSTIMEIPITNQLSRISLHEECNMED